MQSNIIHWYNKKKKKKKTKKEKYFKFYKKFCFAFHRKFDKYAESIIDRCFDIDRDFAINLLRQPATNFFNENPLSLAMKAHCRAFLASKCVQKHLDNEW